MFTRLLVLLLVVAATSAAMGATRSVPEDFGTITEAAAAAAPGDTIDIAAGTYNEAGIDLLTGISVHGRTGLPEDVVVDLGAQDYLFNVQDAAATIHLAFITVTNGAGSVGAINIDVGIDGFVVGTFDNCRFISCTTTLAGGAVSLKGTMGLSVDLDIRNTEFSNCSAGSGGAAIGVLSLDADIVYAMDAVTVDNCTGGAFYLYGSNVNGTILNSAFTNNTGGVLHTGGYGSDSLTIAESTFSGNSNSGGSGGAIFISAGITVEIDHSTFSNNVAGTNGGAIVFGDGGSATVTNSTFSANSAGANGGAIDGTRSPMTLETCTISDNQAVNGGGVYASWHSLVLNNVDLTDNSATAGAGVHTGILNGSQASFVGNTADSGGAIYFSWEFQTSYLSHCDLIGNSADTGSAIYFPDYYILYMNCCDVDLSQCAGGPADDPIPGYSEIHVSNDGCTTPNDSVNWGDLKSMFR